MKKIKENWLIIVMVILVLCAILIAYLAYQLYSDNFCTLIPSDKEQLKRANWGALGDYFGGILNPFFAFFGLIMLLATLIQTQRELSLTRKEFKKSGRALKKQAKTNQLHLKLLKKEEYKKELMAAFNEARDRFWVLSKEKIGSEKSIYNLLVEREIHKCSTSVPCQYKKNHISHKFQVVLKISAELMSEVTDPVRYSIVSEVIDMANFSLEARIVHKETIQDFIDSLDMANNKEKYFIIELNDLLGTY